ncbi:MAG: carbamoyl-phosphate synthase small subunit [Micavibrio sp.]|nr:MAG: carbamoyl-phosphate synthase small subunit [Micavibrio sp.]
MTKNPAQKNTPKNIPWPQEADAVLLLHDGSAFFGRGFGASGTTGGEICFNTSMTGYQEILTDPSYAGQMIVFTFPHIGNTGTNDLDRESAQIFARGLITAEMPTPPANWRNDTDGLDAWLAGEKITGICGIDTRALVRHIRENGAQNALVHYCGTEKERPDIAGLQKELAALPDMTGQDLAATVSCKEGYQWQQGAWNPETNRYAEMPPAEDAPHIVVIDYGVKRNILREIAARGAKITVVPCDTDFGQIKKLRPDGVLLSNGPGDPAATAVYAAPVVQKILAAEIPVFGICLGHQILAIALGGKTEKMPFGHRGGNHPVKNLESGAVEITSQNHGFCVLSETLPKTAAAGHISLFDGSNEGLYLKDGSAFSVQYHPEAAPGPQDSGYLFNRFLEKVIWFQTKKKQKPAA